MGIKIGNTDISKIKIASGETPRLPDAYQEVEYIESSGTQWIDTGVYANEDTVVETKWNLVQYNSNVSYDKIYGTYGTNGADCFMLQSNKPENYKIKMVNYNNGMNTYKIDSLSTIGTGTIYTTKHSATEFWIDGTLQGTCGSISYTTPTTITIFALHDGNTVTQNVYLKLYYFKIYSGATLVRDFVPCYRISDGEIGLYDLENDVFYTNSGSGVFDKGGNLPNLYKNITKVFLGSTQVRPNTVVVQNYIPDMTADSQDGFTATSSSLLNPSEFHPRNAFHANTSSDDKAWHSGYLGAGNWGWSGIQLPSGIKVTKLQIWARNYTEPENLRPIAGFNLMGSNDGTTWTNILSESGLGTTRSVGSTQYWDITGQTTAYTYLKLELQAYSSYIAFDHWNISGEVQ